MATISSPGGRKSVSSSRNPVELLKNPNWITLTVLAVLLVVVIIVVRVTYAVTRRVRRGRAGRE